MDQKDIKEAAASLARAWLAASDMPEMLPDRQRPKDREEAYAIQDEMARIINKPTLGWKMGATSPAISRREGHSGPIVGRVLQGTVFHTPAEMPIARFPNARIEAEFAAVMLADLPPRKEPYTRADIQGKVAIHPSIEIIGNRYPKKPTPPKLSTFDEIADNGTGIGVVLGDVMTGWTDADLQNLVIDIRVDDGPAAENVLGDDRCIPLAVVVDTANMLSKRGIGLHRGEFISTGGMTIPQHVTKGSHFVARYGDFGTITGAFL
jgi:2-keto-4-pentenoate hydratase